MIHPDDSLMKKCIEIAREGLGESQYPIGALVVDEKGLILSVKNSRLISGCDPTAHPEIVAIRESAEKRGSRYLEGCYLYTTLEPCPMCTSAVIWARMKGVVFGALLEDVLNFIHQHEFRSLSWRQITIPAKTIAANGQPRIEVHAGMLRRECCELFI